MFYSQKKNIKWQNTFRKVYICFVLLKGKRCVLISMTNLRPKSTGGKVLRFGTKVVQVKTIKKNCVSPSSVLPILLCPDNNVIHRLGNTSHKKNRFLSGIARKEGGGRTLQCTSAAPHSLHPAPP